jgi:indole-3-glycerol phosphate synthase
MMSKLDEIAGVKRAELARLLPRRRELERAAAAAAAPRDFEAALRGGRLAVIAEVKRRSPSAGWIAEGADAAAVAREYEAGGASAVSVLTDARFFGGALADLESVRAAVALPVLRKDFVLDELQLVEARAGGADAALLIVRLLEPSRLRALLSACDDLGLAALVEAHDGPELEAALESGARIVGVNSRDLSTFRTDVDAMLGLVERVPAERVAVAESGIGGGADAARAAARGADAVLVGERLMRAPSRAALLAELTSPRVVARAGTSPAARP